MRVEHSTGKVRPKPWMRGGRGPPRSRRPFNPDDRCYECGGRGHYAYDCSRKRGGGRRWVDNGYIFFFGSHAYLLWIIYWKRNLCLIENCLIQNLHVVHKLHHLQVFCLGGVNCKTIIIILMWFSNIISMSSTEFQFQTRHSGFYIVKINEKLKYFFLLNTVLIFQNKSSRS